MGLALCRWYLGAYRDPSGYQQWTNEQIKKVELRHAEEGEGPSLFRRIVDTPSLLIEKTINTAKLIFNGFDFVRFSKPTIDADPFLGTCFSLFGPLALTKHPQVMRAILKHHRNDETDKGCFILNPRNSPNNLLLLVNEIFPQMNAGLQDLLMTCNQENSHKYRSCLHKFFQQSTFSRYEERIREIICARIDHWEKDKTNINLTEQSHQLAAEIIGKVFLGYEGEESDQIALAVRILVAYIGKLTLKRPGFKQITALIGWLTRKPIINEPEVESAKKVLINACELLYRKEGEGTIVQAMIKEGFSEAQVKAMLFILFFAGQETTAAAITYMLLKYAQDSALQKTFYEGGIPVQNIVLEALRMFPPAGAIGRKVGPDKDLMLVVEHQDGKVVKRYIKAGSIVGVIPAYAAVESAAANDHPETFLPSRWNGAVVPKSLPSLPWKLFGGGPHECPGWSLAEFEMRAILEELSKNFILSTKILEPRRVHAFTTRFEDEVYIQLIDRA